MRACPHRPHLAACGNPPVCLPACLQLANAVEATLLLAAPNTLHKRVLGPNGSTHGSLPRTQHPRAALEKGAVRARRKTTTAESTAGAGGAADLPRSELQHQSLHQPLLQQGAGAGGSPDDSAEPGTSSTMGKAGGVALRRPRRQPGSGLSFNLLEQLTFYGA